MDEMIVISEETKEIIGEIIIGCATVIVTAILKNIGNK